MGRRVDRTVEALLGDVARYVVAAPGLEPWDYGWCLPKYRASTNAALAGPNGPVTISPEGRDVYAEAVELLTREASVRERWDLEELWGVVASLVAGASGSADTAALISAGVDHLRSAETTMVLMPVANVALSGAPLVLADCVVGELDDVFWRAVDAAANSRPTVAPDASERLTNTYGSLVGRVVIAATWIQGQSALAVEHAEGRVRAILDLALLLEPAPADLGLHSLRGSANRPGVRGVTIHRPALEEALQGTEASSELAAEIAVVEREGASRQLRWHSTEPLPLDGLLAEAARRSLVDRSVRGTSPIARRIRVAARWYSEAHWAGDRDDAMLALGIAMDALVGARSGLPGRAMRERFALLEPEPEQRDDRATRYMEIFSARSAIAHGGASSAVESPGFVRGVARDVVWATYRFLAFEDRFSPGSDNEIDDAFERLRWGTASWA